MTTELQPAIQSFSLSASAWGLEMLGERRKECTARAGREAERAGASESLGRGEVDPVCSFRLPLACIAVLATALLLTGCAGTRPLHPGGSLMHASTGTNGLPEFRSEMKQPENPAQAASQNYERITETELPLPKGSKVTETIVTKDDHHQPVTKEKTIILPEPVVQKTRQIEKAGTSIGAAQKDTARELGAKLSSLKGVVWVGVVLFLFGLATLFYPPLRALIGSVTTSMAISAGGLALIVLPSLVVGNEVKILTGVAVCVGGWFLAHRHGELKGRVLAFKK